VLAGAADRGATTTLVECSPSHIGDGRLDAVDFDVLLFTNAYRECAEAAARASGTDVDAELAAYIGGIIKLLDGLQDGTRQVAVINGDGAWWW
jgi:hypothetical protein